MRINLVCFTALVAALAAASVVPTAANAQNLIQNPGFESGGANWTNTGNVDFALYSGYGMTPTVAFGTGLANFNAGDTTPNAVLFQSFATSPGAPYRVTFVYGNFNANGGGATQTITAAAINTSNTALLGSVVASDIVGGLQTGFAAVMDTTYVFEFNAISTDTTLRFTDFAANSTLSTDGILDNVSVVVIPEAGTIALVLPGIALAGLVVLRRKRVNVR